MLKRLFGLVALLLFFVPVGLMAQVAVPEDGAVPALELVGLLVLAIIPWATRYGYEGVQQLVGALARLPEFPKVLVGVFMGWLVTHLVVWIGLPLPLDIAGWDETTVLGIIEGITAVGLHKVGAAKKKAQAP